MSRFPTRAQAMTVTTLATALETHLALYGHTVLAQGVAAVAAPLYLLVLWVIAFVEEWPPGGGR